jgi:peptidoglycan L-alanyl-D-glutamate endopeptidase CwlK
MSYKFSQTSLVRMRGIDYRLIEVAKLAIELSPIDFGIPPMGGMRTAEEQRQLYLNKTSKCDGYMSRSKHQDGKALDFFAFVNGSASWDKEHMAVIACAFFRAAIVLGVSITWGGLWRNFEDTPHIQLDD